MYLVCGVLSPKIKLGECGFIYLVLSMATDFILHINRDYMKKKSKKDFCLITLWNCYEPILLVFFHCMFTFISLSLSSHSNYYLFPLHACFYFISIHTSFCTFLSFSEFISPPFMSFFLIILRFFLSNNCQIDQNSFSMSKK